MEAFIGFLLSLTENLGYFGVYLLMTVESSFVPFPSEIVVPPAAYLAYQGKMNIFLVVFFGILGSLSGATINYFLARYLGRTVVFSLVKTKIAKIFLITESKIQKAEDYFLKYGSTSTFLGRLIPAIRQLISLPAGFSKMKFHSFIFYTFLGSGLWVVILALLGYYLGANEELLRKYYSEITLLTIGIVIFVILIIVSRWLFLKNKSKNK